MSQPEIEFGFAVTKETIGMKLFARAKLGCWLSIFEAAIVVVVSHAVEQPLVQRLFGEWSFSHEETKDQVDRCVD